MSDQTEPKVPKWPFYVGDVVLLGGAYFICSRGGVPLGHWEAVLAVLCVMAATVAGVAPFVLDYRAKVRLAEAEGLTTAMAQIQHLESIAGQISGATSRWQEAQEQADKTVAAARAITERMTTEVKAFNEFMQRANDSEKANLRLEVDKLRRAEAEWLQVLVRLLDHVYALNQGAARSGHANVMSQISHFQDACRDAARRVGLAPFVAQDAEPFDAQRHQSVGNGAAPPPEATVAETIATGYTFQGRLIRPALVRLNQDATAAPADAAAALASDGAQSPLPLQPDEQK